MLRRIITKRDAAEEWVNEFDAIDQGIIDELMSINPGDWTEVTLPCKYDKVYVYNERAKGEIIEILDNEYKIELDDGSECTVEASDFDVIRHYTLPAWGTMWSFHDILDNDWLSNRDGIKLMSECGFRIYASEKYGYFFGIDGGGYDFYEKHWIPLYNARGLHWHGGE